jgi:hypothetical protein
MFLEAVSRPIKFRFSDGEVVRLAPGRPVELPEARARRVLESALGKVRVIPLPNPVASPPPDEPIILEPADEAVRARPVFWEREGRILGPAMVTDFGKVGHGERATFWVLVEYRGTVVWVRDIMLRSRAHFEGQRGRRQE